MPSDGWNGDPFAPDEPAPGWIVIPSWNHFQHYRDRHPPWIKLHVSLLRNDDFNRLEHRQQIMLVKLWCAYSQNDRRLSAARPALSRLLAQRVYADDLKTLSDAGFIDIVASAEEAHALAPKKEVEVEVDKGQRASKTTPRPNGPVTARACPECGTGGGYHAAWCSLARALR